ncbi:MAG: hypothetical protein JXB34_10235 [Bacteroidales bacterium]|nr:hypothetical protein [Bacteroidales bacterium]
MNTYSKQTNRFNIELIPSENTIIVTTRIQYIWKNSAGTAPWGETEKTKTIEETGMLLLNNPGRTLKLKITGKSGFATEHENTVFFVKPVNAEVNVLPHWSIEINKVLPGTVCHNFIQWYANKIFIDIEDQSATAPTIQSPEKAHTAYNAESLAYWDSHNDEFEHPQHYAPYNISSLGNQLSDSYVSSLLEEINNSESPLVAGAEFIIEG